MNLATRAIFTGAVPDAPARTGTWIPDGTRAAVETGAGYSAFPGICQLDSTHVLVVYRRGTTHLAGGKYVGRIGTLSGTAVSWGDEFDIYDHASLDVRGENMVAVTGTTVTVSGRHYDGTNNGTPFILTCDDPVGSLSSSSTWTYHSVGTLAYTKQNYLVGHVITRSGGYLQPYGGQDTGANHEVGVLLNSSLTDWSAPTRVVVGAVGSSDYSEIRVVRLIDGRLRAMLRKDSGSSTWTSVSTDEGATWSTPASAYDGHGYPMVGELLGGLLLAVYRDAPNGDTAWRTSSDSGATWSSETILDTLGSRSVYATILPLDYSNALCVYAIENSSTDADIYSQVFTRT